MPSMASKNSKKPYHVGIIMDGNRRWARVRKLPTLQGHRQGYEVARRIAEHAFDQGVRYLTLFAFSSENWQRPKTEVLYLMDLAAKVLARDAERFASRGVRVRIIGRRSKMSKGLSKSIAKIESLTSANKKGDLIIAFNYGGRDEIIDAVAAAVKAREKMTGTSLIKHLYAPDAPDPDLIIRTSGVMRLSGFLLWQSAYSELYFSNKLWPDFTTRDFDQAMEEFNRRQRRFGA